MGLFAYLCGNCPDCGAKITDGNDGPGFQVKWWTYGPFDRDNVFTEFQPGTEFPGSTPDGVYPLGKYDECCDTQKPLFAFIANNTFIGFTREEPMSVPKVSAYFLSEEQIINYAATVGLLSLPHGIKLPARE